MWELDNKGWALKNWCLQITVLKKTLESPLDSKGIKPVSHRGNQSWIFIGRTETEFFQYFAEMLRLSLQHFGHLMQRADPLEKSLILEKIKGRSGRGQQWTRWLDDITDSMDMSLSNDCSMIEQTLGDGEGQGSLVYCSPWGHKESDTT